MMEQERAPVRIESFTDNSAARRLASWAGIITGLAVLGIVAVAIWTVREFLPLLGETIIIALGLLIVGGLVWGVVALAKFALATDWHDIGEFGSRERGLFARPIIYAPMTANSPKLTQRKNKTVMTPAIPSIIELIDTGVIAIGQLAMHMGFELGKGGLIPVVDKWPGTFAIAGQGRSGKTRRVLTIIIQAILGQARIFICDPHRMKPDGLAKMVEPLAPWLIIARGHEECMQLTREFVTEMKRRVRTGEQLTPWLIIYDEFSYLMTSNDVSDDDKAEIIELVTDCGTQYAGFFGFAGIIGQIWTNDATGGTAIRRSMHKVFIHTLNAEYAKFFVPTRWANKASELEPRQCLYRQGSEIKQIVTLDVPDSAAEWVAHFLAEKMPPQEAPQVQPKPYMPAIAEKSNFRVSELQGENDDFSRQEPETGELKGPETEINRFSSREEKAHEIVRLRALNFRQGQILQRIWQVKPGATAAYQEALAEYKEILETIMRGA